MAARGTEAKAYVTEAILKNIEGSFINGKEIRVPYQENGETVEIKITLTAAKDNVGGAEAAISASTPNSTETVIDNTTAKEPSLEERERLKQFIASLF